MAKSASKLPQLFTEETTSHIQGFPTPATISEKVCAYVILKIYCFSGFDPRQTPVHTWTVLKDGSNLLGGRKGIIKLADKTGFIFFHTVESQFIDTRSWSVDPWNWEFDWWGSPYEQSLLRSSKISRIYLFPFSGTPIYRTSKLVRWSVKVGIRAESSSIPRLVGKRKKSLLFLPD